MKTDLHSYFWATSYTIILWQQKQAIFISDLDSVSNKEHNKISTFTSTKANAKIYSAK